MAKKAINTLPVIDGKFIPGDDLRVQLCADYNVRLNDGSIVSVPRGFVTDFASIPRIFWNILPPFGDYSPAAVVHDWLYSLGVDGELGRKYADNAFLELMTRAGETWWKRTAMYQAVRMFGGGAWGHPQKENEPLCEGKEHA